MPMVRSKDNTHVDIIHVTHTDTHLPDRSNVRESWFRNLPPSSPRCKCIDFNISTVRITA